VATMAELAEKESLTPSELKRFGKRVHIFKTIIRDGEDFVTAKRRVFMVRTL